MSRIFHSLLISVLSVAMLVACSSGDNSQKMVTKQQMGAVAGAIGGALVAKEFGGGTGNVLSVAAGTILGAYLGSELGATLDRADTNYHEQTAQHALEKTRKGQVSTWHNPDNDNSGSIVPTNTYKADSGVYCREFTQTITAEGKDHEAYGTACRQADGSWKLQ